MESSHSPSTPNVYFGGNAQWKEHKPDHRAFYAYQLKLNAAPLFSLSGSYTLHLYHVLTWIPLLQPVGIAARAFKRWFDVAIKIQLTGQIKGELTFTRTGPDNLKGDWGGKISGEITLSLAADAYFIAKEIAGAGIGGQTSFIVDCVPKQDRSPIEPPTMTATGQWKNFDVTMHWGIKFAAQVANRSGDGAQELWTVGGQAHHLDLQHPQLQVQGALMAQYLINAVEIIHKKVCLRGASEWRQSHARCRSGQRQLHAKRKSLRRPREERG